MKILERNVQEDDVVTILLATYNGERYIEEQIDSILAQTYKSWHILISDDNSSDKTLEIICSYQKKYPGKIDVLPNVGSIGSACGNFLHLMRQAVNRGATYMMFCDQDDVWQNDKIQLTLEEMKRIEARADSASPLLVFTDLQVVDADLNLCARSFIRYSRLNSSRTALHFLLIQNVVTGCTVMFNENLGNLALQYQDKKDILMHDWWIALVAAAFGHIAFLNVPTVRYRQHGGNAVGAKRVTSLKYIYNKLIKNNDIKRTIKHSMQQAGQFYTTFKSMLLPEDQRLLKRYAELYSLNKIRRIIFMIKYRVLKYGVFRKLAQIIWG